ncbi:hypothetical protein [Massilia mucilaginosa]|uniref:hypothetical protein n=1 Tax=Massilia mucilaginosa TaxID=2609282 RepID=UPI001652859A|nr:hypothetical protein [Massilia mucilaginosa]
MTTIFIAGSIKIKHLHDEVQARIMNILAMQYDVVVGDAGGADSAIQQFLSDQGAARVMVYCSGEHPRNNIGRWPVHQVATYHAKRSRAWFTAKDVAMAQAADLGLMVWDGISTGTLSNVVELLARKRNSLVFTNTDRQFHRILSVDDLQALVARMAVAARAKADTSIDLSARIQSLQSRLMQDRILAQRAVQAGSSTPMPAECDSAIPS